MKTPKTVKELCEFVWRLEERYNLLDFEIKGVKPWQAHRIEIYYILGKHFGVFEKYLGRGMSNLERIKSSIRALKNSLFYHTMYNLKEVDCLVFSHPRSKMVDNVAIDIYSHYLIQELKKEGRAFLEFEAPENDGRHTREYKPYKRYLDYLLLYKNLYARFCNLKLDRKQNEIIEKIVSETGVREIKDILIQRTKKYIPTYRIYKKILEKTKPKEIVVIVGYGRAELVKAAKELSIKVIELQHGTFSKYHLGYSYPNYKKELDYFPDEFKVWNDYWKNLIEFPEKCVISVYPFQYLEQEKKRYTHVTKIENQMVVLGQGGITDRIAKKIVDNMDNFKNFTIIFKLHPEEYAKWDNYDNLKTLIEIANVKVVEQVDLYELLAQSEYQAGVFSTALYEGVEFGCRTILFDLPGIEYMEKFIKKYKAKII